MLSQPRQTRMLARRKRRQPFENVCFWRGRQSRWSHCGLECMLSGARNAGCRSNKKMSRKTCFRSSYVFDPRVCHSVRNMVWCQKLASAGRRIVFALHEVMDHGYQLAQTHTLHLVASAREPLAIDAAILCRSFCAPRHIYKEISVW